VSNNELDGINNHPHWWLSFCDDKRPTGSQFLGAAIIPGLDMTDAVVSAHALGVNPGGEVVGMAIDRERFQRVPKRYLHRLLSREECEALNREMLS
jgi:hypothetical protein